MFGEKRKGFNLQTGIVWRFIAPIYQRGTEIISLMSLNCEEGKRQHIPVDGCGAAESSMYPNRRCSLPVWTSEPTEVC